MRTYYQNILFRIPLLLSRAFHLFFGEGACCRFSPTCSRYAADAFASHGIFYGMYLTTRRLLRCHPFGAYGIDPVPHERNQ